MTSFGGTIVTNLDLAAARTHRFASDPYSYVFHRCEKGETLEISEGSACVFFLRDGSNRGAAVASGGHLSQGDALYAENVAALRIIPSATSDFLIASVPRASCRETRLTLVHAAEIKKVIKPWGHELWINGEHPDFALKEIWIKRGHRTSLQYHRLKRETNVLLEGSARLYFKENDSISNDEVSTADLGSADLTAPSAIDVMPNTLHRLEALTDILLFEVSTPHLDDVVRIQDDAKRGNGRIESEHQ